MHKSTHCSGVSEATPNAHLNLLTGESAQVWMLSLALSLTKSNAHWISETELYKTVFIGLRLSRHKRFFEDDGKLMLHIPLKERE